MLIQLATDSLPLVIVLDQLDSIRSTGIDQDLYLMVINKSLPPFVKVVISIEMQNIKVIIVIIKNVTDLFEVLLNLGILVNQAPRSCWTLSFWRSVLAGVTLILLNLV